MWQDDDNLLIEQQKTEDGVQSTVQGWMTDDSPLIDFGDKPLVDFGNGPMTDYGQRPLTDSGQTALTDFDQGPLVDFGDDKQLAHPGQTSHYNFNQNSLAGVSQTSLTEFGQTSLTDSGQTTLTGISETSQTGVSQTSVAGSRETVQTDSGYTSVTDVSRTSQSDFAQKSVTDVRQTTVKDVSQTRPLTDSGDTRYTKDGKRIVHEEEWFYKDGRWLSVWIYEDQILEVEDIRARLETEAYERSRSAAREVVKEEVAKEEKVEEQIKGPGMRITIRGPFKVRQRIPPAVKWKKKVQEVKKISRVLEAMEETDSGVETTPTHEVKKLRQYIYGFGEEYREKRPEIPGVKLYQASLVSSESVDMHRASVETVKTEEPSFHQGILRNVYMPTEEAKELEENIEYQREFGQYVDMERHRTEESISRSEDPTYNRGVEEELRISPEEVNDVIPGLVYTAPCYETTRQDTFDAHARQVLSETPVYLEATEMETVVPVESTSEDYNIPSTDYSTVEYDTVTQQRFQTKEKFMTSEDAEYHKAVEGSIFVSAEEIKKSGNLESFEYENLVPKNIDVSVNKAAKVTVRSLDPTYHKATVGEIKESFNEKTDSIVGFELEKSSQETLTVERNKASSAIVTSETPQFLEAVEMETVTPVESVHEDKDIPDLKYSTLEQSLVTQQRFQTKQNRTTSQEPSYHKAVEAQTFVTPEEIKGKLEGFEYLNLQSENIDVTNDRAVGTTVRSLEPTYNKHEVKEVKDSVDEVKEKIPGIEYETGSCKVLDVEVNKAYTTMVTTRAPRYLEAVEGMAIQPIVEAGAAVEWSVIVFVEPQYTVVAADQYKANQTFTKTQDAEFHRGIERSLFTTAENVGEFSDTFEYHNLNSEYLDVQKNRANETRIKSEDPSYEKAEEKTVKITLDELEGVVPRIVYDRPCYITTKKEVHEAFAGQVPSESPCFYKAEEGEVRLRMVSESNVVGLSPIAWHQAAESSADQQVFKPKSSVVNTQIEYHKGKVEKAYLTLEEVKPNIKKLDYLKSAIELTKTLDTNRVHASKERSENPQYLQVTEGKVDLKIVPETLSKLSPIHWHNAAQGTADQSSFKAKSEKVKTEIEYNKVKESKITLQVEETDDKVEKIRYSKAAVEQTRQLEVSQARASKERSQLPMYLEAKESKLDLQLLPKTSLKKMAPLEFEKLQAADIQKAPFHMVKKESVSVGVPIHRVTENKVEDMSEQISGKIKGLEYEHANFEDVKQDVVKHHTDTTFASDAEYLQAQEDTVELEMEEVESKIAAVGYEQAQEMSIPIIPEHMVKEEAVFTNVPIHRATESDVKLESEEVGTVKVQEYEKANEEEVKQDVLEHQTDLSSSSDAEYHHADLEEVTFEEETVGPAIKPYELDACTESTVAFQQFKANTEETLAAEPRFLHAVQKEMLTPSEQTRRGEPPIPWNKVDVGLINVEVQKSESTFSKSSSPRYQAAERGVELEIEEVRNIKGLDYEAAEQGSVDQVLYTPISEKTDSAKAEYLHADVAKEEVTAESTGTFDGFTMQEPTYMLIEKTERKVDNVALQKTESPHYHKGVENSVSTDVFEIDGEFKAIQYDEPVFNVIPSEAPCNVEVGLQKASVNLITPTEDEFNLELDKTKEGVEPFVVERATIDVEPLQEVSRPLYVSQQDAIMNPLPIHEAEEEEAPEWEKGEETMFEEMKLTKAKPTVALGQLYKPDARQPKVEFAPEPPPVIASEVSQTQRPIEPPPRRRFRLKEKVLDQPLEETEEIPEIEKDTVETKLVPEETPVTAISIQIQTYLMDIKFGKEQDEELELDEIGEILVYLLNNANEDMEQSVTFGKVDVIEQKLGKLDLPKLEFHEEEQIFTAPDLELAPVPRTLFKQPVENTIKDVDMGTVYEIPDAAYENQEEEIVFQDPVHTADENTVDVQKAIYYGEENVSNVETGEFEVFAEPFKTSAETSDVDALELWKALVEESILNMDTLEAEEGNVEEVGLEIISDIAPMSPEEAKEFKLPEELYLEAEHHSLRSSAPVYQPEEGVIEIKEQTVDTIPPKVTGESAQIIAVPTQRLENVTSSTTEILQAQHFGDEGVIEAREEYIYIIPPYEEDDAELSTLPSTQMSRAYSTASRTEQLPEEHSIYLKEQYVNTIAPSVSDTASTSTLPHLHLDQAHVGSSRMERFPEEHSLDLKEQYVDNIPPERGDTANVSSLPHLEMSRAQAEAYRIQQLAREDMDDFEDGSVHGLASDESDKAEESNLPYLEMDRARIEAYRVHQLAREDTDDFEDHSVHGLASDESDKAEESSLPHLELDRARIEAYRVQQLAREDTDDFEEHSVHGFDSDETQRARGSSLPHLEMDRARIEAYRVHQLAREDTDDFAEHTVGSLEPHDTFRARESSLPRERMDRARASTSRVRQMAREDVIADREQQVVLIKPSSSERARTSSLPRLRLDRARAESYRIQQLGREQIIGTRERYVGTIQPSSSYRARSTKVPSQRYGYVVPAPRRRTTTLVKVRDVRWQPLEVYVPPVRNLHQDRVIAVQGARTEYPKKMKMDALEAPLVETEIINVIPPLPANAARMGRIPEDVLQKVQVGSVQSYQAPAERVIGERVEIASVIPPLPPSVFQDSDTPVDVFRKTHAQHVSSHGADRTRETIPATLPEAQLPQLQHRTSMWRLVPAEGPSSDGRLSPVEQRAQHVVTSDDFHRTDSSTLHSNWVPAEIQVVGELDSLMQQGIIRYNPLREAEGGVDAHGHNEVFRSKEVSEQPPQAWSVYRPPSVQQSSNAKVGNIPRVGYPTRQWPSAHSLATDTVADRGDDDFDYDKIIKMTTGGKHELGGHGEPRTGWSTVSVEGSEMSPVPPADPHSMFFKRIPSSQESIYVEQHQLGTVQQAYTSQQYQQPRVSRQSSQVHSPQGRQPFAFDFGRLVHWTVGRNNKIQQLQPDRGAVPQHLVPFDFDKTTTWTVSEKSPDGRAAEEKTYVSVGVPVRVRNSYFVNDTNTRQQTSQTHHSAPPRDNTVHPRKLSENLHWTHADGGGHSFSRDRPSSSNSYQAHASQRREFQPPPPAYPGPPSPGIDTSAQRRRSSQRESQDPYSIGYLERRRRSSQASSISDRWLNRHDQDGSDDDNASLHSWSSYDSSQVRKLDPSRLQMFEKYKAKKRAKQSRPVVNGHI
ncbi:uncharacterized protein LOC144915781 [Branchiostoma floridae x Branchiostoma belcheri]